MLDAMRKNVKSLSIFLWLVIISFIAFYGVTTRNPRETTSVAVVNGDSIPFSSYREEYYRMQDFFRNLLKENADEYLKTIDLKKMVLDRLIEKILLIQMAKKLGVTATDGELINRLKNYDVFLNESGTLDKDRIVDILEKNRIDPKKFIENQKQEILVEKMKKIIEDSAKVSSSEVRDEYLRRNEKVVVEYVFIPNDFYKDKLDIKEADLKTYFEKNRDNYRKPKMEKIRYILIEPKKFEREVKVAEDEIKAYYNKNIDSYRAKLKEVKARHILFSLKPGAKKEEEEVVKKKAERVLKEAKSGKDFVALAQLYSDEPMATVRGGDLGFFGRGRMVPEFEKVAFSLGRGEISNLVRTNFGYHIIKVEEILEPGDPKPFDYVKDEIRKKIMSDKEKDLSLAKANEVFQEWSKQIAKANLDNIMGNKIINVEFEDGGVIEGIGRDTEFYKIVSSLKEGELAKPFLIGKGWIILKLEKKIPSLTPPFEEVKEKVKRDLIINMSAQMVSEEIREWLKKLKEKISIRKIADDKGIGVKESGEINRDSNIPGVADQDNFKELAFSLSENRPAAFFKSKDGFYLLKLVKKIPIDERDYEKKKDEIYKNLLTEEKNRIFSKSIKNLRTQAKIETYTELL